jgi:hypothetical protein
MGRNQVMNLTEIRFGQVKRGEDVSGFKPQNSASLAQKVLGNATLNQNHDGCGSYACNRQGFSRLA